MKDPIEVLLPSGDRILIVLRKEESRDHISFTLLDDLLLDLRHSPVIGLAREPPDLSMASPTHVVRYSIAPSTFWLSFPNRLPLDPRSRARHTPAQDNPSST